MKGIVFVVSVDSGGFAIVEVSVLEVSVAMVVVVIDVEDSSEL
jgi:hypothetical protein